MVQPMKFFDRVLEVGGIWFVLFEGHFLVVLSSQYIVLSSKYDDDDDDDDDDDVMMMMMMMMMMMIMMMMICLELEAAHVTSLSTIKLNTQST